MEGVWPHNGLGARGAPAGAERGSRGPASEGEGGPRGRSPPDLVSSRHSISSMAPLDPSTAPTEERSPFARGARACFATTGAFVEESGDESRPECHRGPVLCMAKQHGFFNG